MSKDNALYAAKARVLMILPPPDDAVLKEARLFCESFCHRYFEPLRPADYTQFDFENWLSSTSYSEKRKQQLREIRAKMPAVVTKLERRWKTNKCFVKKETYPTYKPPRGIFSRTDHAKVWLGPIAKAMEKEAYRHEWFIKHVPVSDRPKFIMEKMLRPGYCYYNTDHSRFEAHMTRKVMETFELTFYGHMLKHYPREFDMLKEMISVENHCCFRDFSFNVEATRMSGDMITSLGNGITNLMATAFVLSRKGLKFGSYPIFVEGDDGLFAAPIDLKLDSSDYKDLGFDVKLISSPTPSLGCFCGMVYTDTEPFRLIKDPMKTLLNFGWTDQSVTTIKKKNKLLVAKAYSLLCELPNCPIVPSLALRVLKNHKGKNVHARFHLDGYHPIDLKGSVRGNYLDVCVDVDSFLRLHPVDVDLRTRELFSDLFGFSPTMQVQIESRLLSAPWPYDFPEMDCFAGLLRDVNDYSAKYVCSLPIRNVRVGTTQSK